MPSRMPTKNSPPKVPEEILPFRLTAFDAAVKSEIPRPLEQVAVDEQRILLIVPRQVKAVNPLDKGSVLRIRLLLEGFQAFDRLHILHDEIMRAGDVGGHLIDAGKRRQLFADDKRLPEHAQRIRLIGLAVGVQQRLALAEGPGFPRWTGCTRRAG